ncbi:MAG: glycosyl hydrolase-related protein [Candidatus Omnitrophica bacterium]|nr:glycosyl hydrolase-related protein [Candidatus Omnitrophota bacterium]
MSVENRIKELEKTGSNISFGIQDKMLGLFAEMDFAKKLADIYKNKEWNNLIETALLSVEKGLSKKHTDDLITEVESILKPIGKVAKEHTILCVGHAHIDMNWMWSYPETCAVVNDTFTTVLKLMEEFPDFCFSQSQASVYKIVEKYNPDMLKQIQKRVKEGRWEVTAGFWVECDKNLSGGEALCRHLLYTRNYFKKIFDLEPEDVSVDWSPDTFGHALTIPTIISKAGIKYYYGHRYGMAEAGPQVFLWKGPDGSSIIVRNDKLNGYNGVIDENIGKKLMLFTKETGLKQMMYVYGVGDHGGGPTKRDILRAYQMDKWPIFPNVKFSTTRIFYQYLEENKKFLPVLECELNFENTGCYTSQSLIKRANRFAENQLYDAEVAVSVVWAMSKKEYPGENIYQGWIDTLFSQFHDILPGSGVHDTRTYCHGKFQDTVAATEMAETNALRFLAGKINTDIQIQNLNIEEPVSFLRNSFGAGVGFGTGEGFPSSAEQSIGKGLRPFIIFNPNPWQRKDVVITTIWDNDPQKVLDINKLKETKFSIINGNKKKLSGQLIDAGGYWGHLYAKVAFPVEIPSLGYNTYAVVEEETLEDKKGVWLTGTEKICPYIPIERLEAGLENDLISVEIDIQTGGLKKVFDKKNRLNLIDEDSPSGVLNYEIERPHSMTAWTLADIEKKERLQVISIDKKHNGPYIASIEVKLKYNESTFTVIYQLKKDDPTLYMDIEGIWVERGTEQKGVPVLRISFPSLLKNIKAKYEIPFGSIERDLNKGQEVPALNWAFVSGNIGAQESGFILSNDCKYGYSLKDSTLSLTLIRSSYDPDILPEIGQHKMKIAFTPFTGKIKNFEAIRKGLELNHQLRVIGTTVHKGDLPDSYSFFKIGADNIGLSCFKKAEKEDGLVLRFYETEGKDTEFSITLNNALKIKDASEVDILERRIKHLNVKDNTMSLKIDGYSIKTIIVSVH